MRTDRLSLRRLFSFRRPLRRVAKRSRPRFLLTPALTGLMVVILPNGCYRSDVAPPVWQPVPWRSDAASPGGEGCQVISAVARAQSDPRILLMGTDVGGLYRSRDGGVHWEPCNRGYKPRGCAYVAIDPANANRFFAVGGNGNTKIGDWHGIWRSEDQGETWTSVLPRTHAIDAAPGRGYDQFAFDATSVHDGGTQTIYWSSPTDCSPDPGLYKTTDGGAQWQRVSSNFAGSLLAAHPKQGIVYLGNSINTGPDRANGLWRMDAATGVLTRLRNEPVRGLAVTRESPDRVYIVTPGSRRNQILVSARQGAPGSWSTLPGKNLPDTEAQAAGLARISVSPADHNRMFITDERSPWFQRPLYWSHDGGVTWDATVADLRRDFFHTGATDAARSHDYESRHHPLAWHPTDPNSVVTTGKDMLLRSEDGGKNFVWSNDGYNGVAASGNIAFNVFDPALLLTTSQDYNAALTADGGRTWKPLQVAYGWGGSIYGGYAFSAGPQGRMFAGRCESWYGPRLLTVSTNGGDTWTFYPPGSGVEGGKPEPLRNEGPDVANGDPTDSKTAFWGNWRTRDQGATWSRMTGCKAVYLSNPADPAELWGVTDKQVVRSHNHGDSWTVIAEFPESVGPIAYDHQTATLWAVVGPGGGRKLYRWNAGKSEDITGSLPADNNGARIADAVAVDPGNTRVVYVGRSPNIYDSNLGVIRSLDRGASWQPLTQGAPGSIVTAGPDGGHEVSSLRVNPRDHYLWVYGGCFGIYRFPPPAEREFAAKSAP